MSDTETAGRARLKTWSYDAYVVGIALAGNDRTFAAGLSDGRIVILDADTAEPNAVAAHDGACLSLAADSDNDAFLSGGDDGKLQRIDAKGEVSTLAHVKNKWVDHVTAHAGGVRAYAVGKDVFILDRKNKGEPRKLSHATTVGGLAINAKGRRLAVSHYNGVSLWWLAAQDSKPQLLDWKGSHLMTVWHPDGDYVITAMQENALHGWRLSDGQHMRMTGYGAKVKSLSFSRRGQLLATGGAEAVICWPFLGGGPMGKPPIELGGGPASEGAGTPVTAVACNPKRDIIAAGFANGAVILSAPQVRSVGIIGAGKAPITALTWNGAGDRLAVGDEAGDVMLADFRS